MKELELTVKLRNNLIKERRLELGYRSQVAFAKAVGVTGTTLCAMETLRFDPVDRATGEYKVQAKRVATFFGLTPEDLWPPSVLEVAQPIATTKLDARDVKRTLRAIAERPQLPAEALEVAEARSLLNKSIKQLMPFRQKVLHRRFVENKTLEEIGNEFHLSKERIRRICDESLERLRKMPAIRELGPNWDPDLDKAVVFKLLAERA